MRFKENIETRLTGRHKKSLLLSGNVAGKNVLNIGCSIGWYEKATTNLNCQRSIGVDTNYNAIIKAKSAVAEADFMLSSAIRLPFHDDHFDVVTMFDVIEHIPRHTETQCLQEINRVLTNNGTLIISTPNSYIWAKLLDPAWYLGHRHYSETTFKSLMTDTGFQVDSIEYGGRFYELISMVLLYIFKWLFRSEIPFKSWFDKQRDKEYLINTKGFATLFVSATKNTSNN